jgi:Lrp/AsnC family leucine-responsive transcriptional regulator
MAHEVGGNHCDLQWIGERARNIMSQSKRDCVNMPNLDAIDHRIIAVLQADGRLSNVQLAERVGLSPSPCLRRLKRLERDGYIEGYRAVVERGRVGLGLTVFIGVKIDGHANERAEAFQDMIVGMPEIVACYLVAGEVDYLLEVVVPDLEHYQQYLVGKLLNLPIIREVRSNIAIQTLKAGAPLPLNHLGRAAVGSASSRPRQSPSPLNSTSPGRSAAARRDRA